MGWGVELSMPGSSWEAGGQATTPLPRVLLSSPRCTPEPMLRLPLLLIGGVITALEGALSHTYVALPLTHQEKHPSRPRMAGNGNESSALGSEKCKLSRALRVRACPFPGR